MIFQTLCPVQSELTHRECFSNASDALGQNSSDGFLSAKEEVVKDVTAVDWFVMEGLHLGSSLKLPDLMLVINPFTLSRCDVELCEDAAEGGHLSDVCHTIKTVQTDLIILKILLRDALMLLALAESAKTDNTLTPISADVCKMDVS